jgi:hypothetical protein
VLLLLRPVPQYLETANGGEHAPRKSTLYSQSISCDGDRRRPNLHRSRSASATVMGVHLEAANGGEHSARKSTLIHGPCAQLLGKEFVALLSPANVCGCELSVPNQHFRNAGPQPTFLKCSTGYRPGYYPALQADQIVERLLRRLTPRRGVRDCTLTNKLLPASRPSRSVPSDFTMQPPTLAFAARTCTAREAAHARHR